MKYPRILMALSAVLLALVVVRPGHAHQLTQQECSTFAGEAKEISIARNAGTPLVEEVQHEWKRMTECTNGACNVKNVIKDHEDISIVLNFVKSAYAVDKVNVDTTYLRTLEDCVRQVPRKLNPDPSVPVTGHQQEG